MNGGNNMKRKMLSVLLAVFMAIGLFPVTALAAEGAPDTLWVGETQITGSGYWKTTADGKLEPGSESDYNVYYDGNGTLTLNGATIQGGTSTGSVPYGAGIYAQCSNGQSVTLTIKLIGENTITGYYGIYVNAEISANSNGTDASLTIMGENNGSLEVSGSFYGIFVKSGTGNASLTIENASVVAKTTQTNSGYAGVCVQSSANATGSPQLSLAVNGGSLTTSGSASGEGIEFYVGAYEATSATTSLTVTDHAIVDARTGGISASGVRVNPNVNIGSTGSTGGIVFDGTEGTVYGDVTLDESLTINQSETLTIPEGSTLNTNGNLTNNGTIVNTGGTLTGDPGGTIVTAPAITTKSLPEGTVGESYTATLEATGNNMTWSLDSGTLPDGLTLNSDGTITGTPTAEGTSTFTVTATNSAGSVSKEYTLTIKPAVVSVTGVTLDKSALSLTPGKSETLTATVAPNDATNQTVTWSSNNSDVATVTDGKVTAVKAGTATITVTTADGNKTASCNVTVTQPVTGVTLDKSELSLFPGESETLTATVAPNDATNQAVTWKSSNDDVATVTDGKVIAVKAGTATITVTTEDGGYTASCKVTVTDAAYSLSADPSAIDFGTVKTGYTQPGAKTVTVTNTGNQSLTLQQPKADHFDIGELSQTELAPGESATFTVQPKAKLPFGTFNDSISISAASGSNEASTTITTQFTVERRTADAANDNNKDQTSSPQTGDDSNLLLWGVLAVVALAGLICVIVMMKRKK